MSWETLEKVTQFIADPMGCEELARKSSGQGAGHDSLDLHYPTRGVGDAYDSNQSFWDRRKQDYCNMPAALSLIQTGSLGVRGLPQMSRGMKGVPAWLQHWLDQPKPRPETMPKPPPSPVIAQTTYTEGKVTVLFYRGGKFQSSLIIKSKNGPLSPQQYNEIVEREREAIEGMRPSTETLVVGPPRVIWVD